VRNEESAVFAACGYAKHTGSLGVATSGPGATHLLNVLYDAKLDAASRFSPYRHADSRPDRDLDTAGR
jgi:hypothetical protein